MKPLHLALAVSLLSTAAWAQTIPANQAMAHVGQTVTVEGVVGGVKTARSGVTFIDVDGRYPNAAFTGVIFADDAKAVGDMQWLTGRKLDISGKIQLYNGRPEIIVHSRNQLHLAK
jgi:hypothetical protein